MTSFLHPKHYHIETIQFTAFFRCPCFAFVFSAVILGLVSYFILPDILLEIIDRGNLIEAIGYISLSFFHFLFQVWDAFDRQPIFYCPFLLASSGRECFSIVSFLVQGARWLFFAQFFELSIQEYSCVFSRFIACHIQILGNQSIKNNGANQPLREKIIFDEKHTQASSMEIKSRDGILLDDYILPMDLKEKTEEERFKVDIYFWY